MKGEVLSRGHETTVLPDTRVVLPDTRVMQDARNNFNDVDLANRFNDYFNSIGENLSKTISPPEGATYQQ